MSREEHLLEAARAATRDDTIFDVGIMRPRGFAAVAGAAGGAGAAAGDALGGTIGAMVGSAGGAAAGMAGVETARGLPGRTCLAASPTHIHLLGMHATGWDAWPIATIDRAKARVEVHGRVMNRILVIEDTESGAKYELEAPRVNPYHTGDLVDLLAGTDAGDALERA